VCGISGSNAGYTMFRGSVKGTGYPLHSPVSPSLPLPCVTVCNHISTGLYKAKFVTVQPMTVYARIAEGGIAPHILQFHTGYDERPSPPRPTAKILPRIFSQYLSNMMLVGVQDRSGRFESESHPLSLPVLESFVGYPARSLATTGCARNSEAF